MEKYALDSMGFITPHFISLAYVMEGSVGSSISCLRGMYCMYACGYVNLTVIVFVSDLVLCDDSSAIRVCIRTAQGHAVKQMTQ